MRAQSILRATIGRSTLGKGLASTAAWWNALPDGHKVTLFNVWAGRRRIDAFRARLRADLSGVLDLLAQGSLAAQVAARIPVAEAAHALELAESGTVTGKVVLVPDHRRVGSGPGS